MSRHHYTESFVSKERTRIMYEEYIPGFDLVVGKVNQSKAYKPIEPHSHQNAFEIVYIVKGKQVYTIEDILYEVTSGHCFITLPNERHSSGGYPEDKSILYYVIISSELITTLGFNGTESRALLESLSNPVHRIFLGCAQIPQVLEKLSIAPNDENPFYKTAIKQHLTQFLLSILSSMNQHPLKSNTSLLPTTTYIQNHLKEPIAIKDLATLMNLSESRFKTHFREVIGIPPAEYILREKVTLAKQLLEHTSLNITEIAFELSFSSSQYFSTVFKRFTTFSPAQYRKNLIYSL